MTCAITVLSMGQGAMGAHKRKYEFCLGALGGSEVMTLKLVPEDTWKMVRYERM